MASYLQIENISKSYGTKVLFENIRFNINEGDKIALIAPNGTGKTSLLRILSGRDKSDSNGKILFLKDIRIAFLEQEYSYDPASTVFGQIMSDSLEYTEGLDEEGIAEYGRRVRRYLTDFSLGDGSQRMDSLSGGEVKRVALARMLSSEADFFIMDEPTNHLDIEAIEYLEQLLSHSRRTLLMVTHDRYFLERICNTVMELDHGALYTYRGGYMDFLEKRQERIDNYNAETDKVRNVLRRELEWMRSTPQARTGKAKYRKEVFEKLRERSGAVRIEQSVDMSVLQQDSTYLGNKVVDCRHLSFSWEGKCYIKDFTYNFQRYDRVGIVGRNASGKSTFLNLIAGEWTSGMGGEKGGEIETGSSVKTGYYRQEGIDFKEDRTVLETVGDTRLLNRFLFPHEMFDNRISTLSGGEKRRLYLITVLMQQPNLLILDEPTNHMDIIGKETLENMLSDFDGSVIFVSHDRYFVKKVATKVLDFTKEGVIPYNFGYAEYEEKKKGITYEPKDIPKAAAPIPEKQPAKQFNNPGKERAKLEKKLEKIEAMISETEDRVKALKDELMNPDYASEYTKLSELQDEIDRAETEIMDLMEQWAETDKAISEFSMEN